MTLASVPSASDSIVGSSSPPKRIFRYGSSSKIQNPCSAESSTKRRRLASDKVHPAGLWKLGMM